MTDHREPKAHGDVREAEELAALLRAARSLESLLDDAASLAFVAEHVTDGAAEGNDPHPGTAEASRAPHTEHTGHTEHTRAHPAGSTPAVPTPAFDLAALIDGVLAEFGPAADEVGLVLRRCGAASAATGLDADAALVRQIVRNLVSNAVKFNRPGGSVTVRLGTGAKGRFRIAVEDTGTGLDRDQRGRLFHPYDRLGAPSSVEGLGLGLVLTRELVERLGGALHVTSLPGVGSTFTVELPRRRTGPVTDLIDLGRSTQTDGAVVLTLPQRSS